MALLPKNQRDQAMTLVSIIGLALIGLYWVYVFSPKSEELATVQMRVDSLEAKNAAAKKEMATGSVEKVKSEAARYEKDLDVMRQLVPTGNEVPALLEQVSTAARRVGLDIATVEPEAVVEGEQFDTYRYKLAVSGGYHAVGEFLTNVGSLTRIVAPVNVSLANSSQRNQKAARDDLDAHFEVQTYVSKSAPRARGGKS
ncbi:MAG: type 4a pilus biogenesis protein PilO [Gemmatimonadaceae bacterium]